MQAGIKLALITQDTILARLSLPTKRRKAAMAVYTIDVVASRTIMARCETRDELQNGQLVLGWLVVVVVRALAVKWAWTS